LVFGAAEVLVSTDGEAGLGALEAVEVSRGSVGLVALLDQGAGGLGSEVVARGVHQLSVGISNSKCRGGRRPSPS